MPRIRASGDVGVQVHGLAQLSRSLKALGGREFQNEVKEAGLDIATDVASDARGIAMSLGGVAAKTAPSIKAAAGVSSAGVSLGGAGYPFAAGAEFGSIRYKQFRPWRGNGPDAGYFVYQSIRDNVEDIATRYEEALDEIIRRHGL